jgi:hypothetical protein
LWCGASGSNAALDLVASLTATASVSVEVVWNFVLTMRIVETITTSVAVVIVVVAAVCSIVTVAVQSVAIEDGAVNIH